MYMSTLKKAKGGNILKLTAHLLAMKNSTIYYCITIITMLFKKISYTRKPKIFSSHHVRTQK